MSLTRLLRARREDRVHRSPYPREGFRAFTLGLLERLLKRTTDHLWKAISFGIVTTIIMQSSSLVSVISISFLSAGLIWLSAGIGIIFGANIGATIGAWLVAGFGLKVKISAYAMPILVFGIILVFQKTRHLKGTPRSMLKRGEEALPALSL